MSLALKELDDLRSLLETRGRGSSYGGMATDASRVSASVSLPRGSAREALSRSVDAGLNDYTGVLSNTEDNVDRLNRAMETAEEEMEAAFRRAGDIHRVQVQRRDYETQELKRLLAAKDRAIDNMKDAIISTKRTLEAKMNQLETSLAQRDAELLRVQDENRQLRSEVRSLKDDLDREAATAQFAQETLTRKEGETEHKLSEMHDTVKELVEDKSRLAAKLQTALLEKESALKSLQINQAELDALRMEHHSEKESARIELSTWKEKVQVEEGIRKEYQKRYESEKAKRKLSAIGKEQESASFKELEKKLRSERRCRKASEKWLKAELNSREELETLFMALRDVALSKDKRASELGLDEVARLLKERPTGKQSSRYVSPNWRGGSSSVPPPEYAYSRYSPRTPVSDALRTEFEVSRRLLEEDNTRLKHDLHEARRVLTERLMTSPRRSRRL